MTTQLSPALNYAAREKTPRLMGSGSKWDGCELGYRPTTHAHWRRERPTEPGVYAVVPRCGGLWLGDMRCTGDDWRGWWCSVTVEVMRALKRPMPPAGDW